MQKPRAPARRHLNGVDPDAPPTKPEQEDRLRLDNDYDVTPAVQRRTQNRKS